MKKILLLAQLCALTLQANTNQVWLTWQNTTNVRINITGNEGIKVALWYSPNLRTWVKWDERVIPPTGRAYFTGWPMERPSFWKVLAPGVKP